MDIGNLQRQMRIKLQHEDDLRNMTMFYSRVRVWVRTVATLCFCTCVSFPGVQFICTAKQLGRVMCVHKCVFPDLICLYMLQLGEGKCVPDLEIVVDPGSPTPSDKLGWQKLVG